MSTPIVALENYTRAIKNLKDHQALNKAVFDQHQNLVFVVMDAENALRDAVAEAGAGVQNNDHIVTYTPQEQTWADIEVLDQMVIDGKIKPEDYAQIVKTQSRPPRITIGEQKN